MPIQSAPVAAPAAAPAGQSREEIARLGMDLLKRVIEPALPAEDAGRYVVVDVRSGAYEVDDDDWTAVRRLRARVPDAESYLCRVGEEASDRMGPR